MGFDFCVIGIMEILVRYGNNRLERLISLVGSFSFFWGKKRKNFGFYPMATSFTEV